MTHDGQGLGLCWKHKSEVSGDQRRLWIVCGSNTLNPATIAV
jgi:hypothetical protein